jgi:large repetitive protein
VTENPAWALGLAGRLAALKVGLAGDVAVFAQRTADPYQSVVEAGPADVRLVLRQGTPLYGNAELVKAFRDGETCEAIDVCGAQQRVCAVETELALGAVQQAGEAVYPLFSCEQPPNEPHCEALVSHECPSGEATCEPPPPLPAWNAGDADADGVVDVLDVCPRASDPDQTDADGDGRGDACDGCPVGNPGLTPCPVSIAELRAPSSRLPLKAAVLLGPGRVTAMRTQGTKGFYVEDGDHRPYSGIFVYASSAAAGVELGDLVQLRGYFDTFQGTDELAFAEVVSRSAVAGDYAPLVVRLADAADGSALAAGLGSLFIRIEGASVGSLNPDAPKDYDETGLIGGLRLDDLLWPELDNAFAVGTSFGAIQGIAGFSFGHQKLYPRGPADLLMP